MSVFQRPISPPSHPASRAFFERPQHKPRKRRRSPRIELVVGLFAQVVDQEPQPWHVLAECREHLLVGVQHLLEAHRRRPAVPAVVQHDGHDHRQLADLASPFLGQRGEVLVPDPDHVAHHLERRERPRVALVLPEEVDQRLPARDARGVEEIRAAVLEVLVDEAPGLQAQRRQVNARDDGCRERGGEDAADRIRDRKECVDVGLAKRTVTNPLQTLHEEIVRYRIDDRARGTVLLNTLVSNLEQAESDEASPGRLTVATDETRFLVVVRNNTSSAYGSVGGMTRTHFQSDCLLRNEAPPVVM
jgi:hypothetical protein